MTAPAVTVGPESTVAAAARLMLDHGVNRLPVVGRDGGLLGIITRADLVRAFGRADHAIAAEIRDDILQRVLWVDPASFTVRVERGEVELVGELRRGAGRGQLVEKVPGVVSVTARRRDAADVRRRSDRLGRRLGGRSSRSSGRVPASRRVRRLRDRTPSPGLEVGVYVLVAPEPDRQQAHEDDEVYVVLGGRGVLEIEGVPVPLEPGQGVFVPAGADHRFTGYEGLSVLVVLHRRSAGLGRVPV